MLPAPNREQDTKMISRIARNPVYIFLPFSLVGSVLLLLSGSWIQPNADYQE